MFNGQPGQFGEAHRRRVRDWRGTAVPSRPITLEAARKLRGLAAEHGFGAGCIDFRSLDHDKKAYLRDLHSLLSRGWLREGTIIDADNVEVPGAPKYRALMRQRQGRSWQTVEHKTHGEYGTVIPALVFESVYLGEEPVGE